MKKEPFDEPTVVYTPKLKVEYIYDQRPCDMSYEMNVEEHLRDYKQTEEVDKEYENLSYELSPETEGENKK